MKYCMAAPQGPMNTGLPPYPSSSRSSTRADTSLPGWCRVMTRTPPAPLIWCFMYCRTCLVFSGFVLLCWVVLWRMWIFREVARVRWMVDNTWGYTQTPQAQGLCGDLNNNQHMNPTQTNPYTPTCTAVLESCPEVGSSLRKTAGPPRSSTAFARRRRSPPDRPFMPAVASPTCEHAYKWGNKSWIAGVVLTVVHQN